jgi:tRNA nucleotidyltransferase (CCA-adding enzyme)
VRFAARFGFSIAPATWAAAVEAASGLEQLSAERVRDEWFKSLRTARSVPELVDLWRRVGAAERWMPELQTIDDERLARAGTVPIERRDPVLLSALLLDDAAPVLRRLRASNADIERAAALSRGPAAPADTTARTVRRWLAAVGRAADDLLELHAVRDGAPAPWADEVAAVRERRDPLTRADLAVDGRDLHALGLSGPRLGRVLNVLLERVLDDPSRNTREALLAIAREVP